MNKRSLKNLLLAVALFAAPSAFAQSTWTNTDANGNWNDANNWSPAGIPNAAATTANVTLNGGGTVTINSPVTVGTLNIGTGTTGAYTLNNNSSSLTLNNSGSGAQINQVSTSVGDTINVPIGVADTGGLTITNSSASASGTLTLTKAITGTGNLVINNDSSVSGSGTKAIFFSGSGATINNAGTLSFDGTSSNMNGDAIRIEGAIGSNVTSIIQNGATLAHIIGGETIGGNTSYINNGTASLLVAQNAITGTGNLTLSNNTSINAGVDLSESSITINTTGTITINGTGTGITYLGGIGSTVTAVIVASTSNSGVRFNSGTITVNAGGTTLENDSAATQILTVGGVTGTGDLILDNTSTGTIELAQSQQNNTGRIINQSTGTGAVGLDVASTTLGANLTALVQNSATSGMNLRLGGTNPFTGSYIVQAGTMTLNGGNSNYAGGTKFIVGDTAAHSSAKLALNIDGGTWTPTATQAVSGFGTITSQNVATVSGGTLAPGSTGNIGKLTINQNLNLAGGTNLTFALGTATGTAATSTSSQLAVGGTLTLPAAILTLNLSSNAGANGQGSLGNGVYELLSYNSLTGATLGDITSMFTINGPSGFTYSVFDTHIGAGAGQIDLMVLPEPGTWALMLAGLGLLCGMQKLRRRRA